VRRLEAAGYASAGKTNLHEFAYGISSQNQHYGTVPNPVAPGRTAGGSSGGTAAAIAAGICDHGLGTDSGGSIRIPAACCGIAGFKPSFGLLPLEGVFPLAPSFDHAGPMARDVRGCVRLMEALLPGLAVEPLEADAVTVGVAWLELADEGVRTRVEAAAAAFPATRRQPFPEPAGIAHAFMRDVAGVHRELFEENRELYGENPRTKIELCLAVTDDEADAAAANRREYQRLAAEAFDGVDLLLTPTLMFVAPPADIEELAWRDRMIRFTYPFNVLGWPALALPCGPAEDGLPASVQLAGRPGTDELVLAAGLALEAALADAAAR
jgi:aspartyl-tRNA(Asn)/glutamyl-tRNA(Gln) amidotransferase subunit A